MTLGCDDSVPAVPAVQATISTGHNDSVCAVQPTASIGMRCFSPCCAAKRHPVGVAVGHIPADDG